VPVTIEGIDVAGLGKLIGEAVKAATIRAAEAALTAEVAKGFDNEPVVVTDGVRLRDYEQVKPFGRIEFIARPNMADAVLWALTELQKKSPVLTGRYASHHTVMVNGVEVAGNIKAALQSVKPTDRVQIVNPEPYAKKLEGQAASRRRQVKRIAGLSRQAPNGVYRAVLAELVSRYGKSMFFDYKFVKLDSGRKYVRHGKGRRSKAGRDYVYPALQFFIKPTELPN